MRDFVLTIAIFGVTVLTYWYFGRAVLCAAITGVWSMNGEVVTRSERPLRYYLAMLASLWFLLIVTGSSFAMAMFWLM